MISITDFLLDLIELPLVTHLIWQSPHLSLLIALESEHPAVRSLIILDHVIAVEIQQAAPSGL
jgi:hypothetical protein